MRAALHRVRHWLGWQPIEVVTEWRNRVLFIGARCVVCGEVDGWHSSRVRESQMPPAA